MTIDRIIRISMDTFISLIAGCVIYKLAGFWGVPVLLAYGLWNYWDGLTRRFLK